MSPASPGYQAPSVTVSSSLPKGKDGAVLIVPVVSGPDEKSRATVVASPFLDAEAVGEIEVALEALGAKGGAEQITRLVAAVAAGGQRGGGRAGQGPRRVGPPT